MTAASPIRAVEQAARRALRPDVLVLAVASIVLWLARMHIATEVAVDDLDASWRQALAHAFERGWLAGVDWLFPAGPLGCFHNPIYDRGLFWTDMIVWECGLKLVAAVLITTRMVRLGSVLERALVFALIVCLPLETDAYALLAQVAATAWILDRPTLGRPVVAFGILLLAAFALAKFTLLAVSLACVLLIAFALLRAGSRGMALAFLASCAAVELALWLLSGQSLSNIVPYLSGSLEIASGYNEAMSITPRVGDVIVSGIASAGMALAAWACIGGSGPRVLRLCASAGLLAAWIVAFKAGFTRADHTATFWTFACAAPFLLGDPPAAGRLQRICVRAGRVACAAAALFGLARMTGVDAPRAHDFVAGTAARIVDNARSLGDLPGLARELEAARELEQRSHDLPQVRLAVGRDTIDAIPFQVGRLLLADLNWKPRITIQSYCAFTPALLARSADCLRGDRAPRFVLFRPRTIDVRLPTMDDGEALQVLARDYRPVLIEDGSLLLRHAPRTVAPRAPECSIDRSVRFGELVDISSAPGACQLLALDIRYTAAGRLRTVLFNAPRVILEIHTDTGVQRRFRIVPGMMKSGVILNPLIVDADDWLRWGLGLPLPRVTSVEIVPTGSPWMYAPDVRLRLLRADDVQPVWSEEKPRIPPVMAADPASAAIETIMPAVQLGPEGQMAPEAGRMKWIESDEPIRTMWTRDRTITVVHAPSRFWIPVAAGHHRLSGDHGFAQAARQAGCEAAVRVDIILAEGEERITLLDRDLDNARAEDLTEQSFDLEFDCAAPAWLWLATRDMGRDPVCAWTYWSRLRLD